MKQLKQQQVRHFHLPLEVEKLLFFLLFLLFLSLVFLLAQAQAKQGDDTKKGGTKKDQSKTGNSRKDNSRKGAQPEFVGPRGHQIPN